MLYWFWPHWRYKCSLWEEECAKIVNKYNNFFSWEHCSSKDKRWSGHFLLPVYLVAWSQHWPFWGFQANLPGWVWESLDPSFSCVHHTWECSTQIHQKLNIPIYFTCESTPVRVVPVIRGTNEEDCFPIFADMNSSIYLFDAWGETIITDGASMCASWSAGPQSICPLVKEGSWTPVKP